MSSWTETTAGDRLPPNTLIHTKMCVGIDHALGYEALASGSIDCQRRLFYGCQNRGE